MMSRKGRRAIEEPMTIRATGTVMLPTMVTGRENISGVCIPKATMKAATKAAIMAGENSTFALS